MLCWLGGFEQIERMGEISIILQPSVSLACLYRYLIVTSFMLLIAWPTLAIGKDTSVQKHVGVLVSGKETDKNARSRLAVFKKAMQAFGWRDGKNVRYDVRWGNSNRQRVSSRSF